MAALRLLRSTKKPSYWRPDSRVLRTIQAPQHVAGPDGAIRISSAALVPSDADHACSVDAEQLLHEDGLPSDALYPGLARTVGLYALLISQLRAEKTDAHHDPIWSNWYHAGMRGDGLKSHGVRRRLAKLCTPVVAIDEAEVRRLRAAADSTAAG